MATTVSADSISLSGIADSADRIVMENPALASRVMQKLYTHVYRDVAPVDTGEPDDFALAQSSLDTTGMSEEAGYAVFAGSEDAVDAAPDSDDEYLALAGPEFAENDA